MGGIYFISGFSTGAVGEFQGFWTHIGIYFLFTLKHLLVTALYFFAADYLIFHVPLQVCSYFLSDDATYFCGTRTLHTGTHSLAVTGTKEVTEKHANSQKS